jgi:hypothetical protein
MTTPVGGIARPAARAGRTGVPPNRAGSGLSSRYACPETAHTQNTVTARRILLDGLARDADIFDLASELAPLHPRNNTFPGEVFLHLAADALDWCGASRTGPLSLEGIRDRFLPECTFRGRQNKKFHYAVLAAAALHGGTEPDLLDEIAWWQTDDRPRDSCPGRRVPAARLFRRAGSLRVRAVGDELAAAPAVARPQLTGHGGAPPSSGPFVP